MSQQSGKSKNSQRKKKNKSNILGKDGNSLESAKGNKIETKESETV